MNMKHALKRVLLRYLPPTMLIWLKQHHYAKSLQHMGIQDEQDLAVAMKLVRPGDYVVDVGANIGLYTKTLSAIVGENGRVYSIEPIPLTFRILRYCTQALGLTNVRLLQTAVSDAAGIIRMEVPKYDEGGDNFYMARIANGNTAVAARLAYTVKTETLDSILSDVVERISFVKCDVEGHEWAVLKGAQRLLNTSPAAWLIEVSGDPDHQESSANRLFRHMRDIGYEAYRYDAHALHRRRAGDVSVNYFFLKPLHLDRLAAMGMTIVG